MGKGASREGKAYQERLIPIFSGINCMDVSIYLQIISIFVAIIAVALPALIAIVGYVYIRNIAERIENIAADVNELWDRVSEKQP